MLQLIEGGRPRKIKFPIPETESDIQRKIANAIEAMGFDVSLEVTVEAVGIFGKRTMRLDILVTKESMPVACFEVKKPSTMKKHGKHELNQSMFMTFLGNNGVPSCFVASVYDAVSFMERRCAVGYVLADL